MSTFNKYRTKGAFHWDWYETEDWYKYLVDRCVKFCDGETLDVGCGDGLLLSKLPKGSMGIDPDFDGIMLAKQKDLYAFQASAADIHDHQWDYLASINVIEHMDRPEDIKDLINDRITKGAIITTIDYQGGPLGEDHKFEWTYDEMMDFFKEFNPKGFRYKDTEWIGVEITK